MELKPALEKLEQSEDFRRWHEKHKETYFSYAFKIEQEMPNEWQLGYYDSKKDKITTFVMKDGSIMLRGEEDIFKKEDMKVDKIEIDRVKVTFENAISKANEFQRKNFPKDRSVKTIAILQNINNLGNVWNITCITESFNTLNIKIDASTGKIAEHSISSVFSFRKE